MNAATKNRCDNRILACVLLISLLWGLSFGLNYGSGNHNTYLLYGLKIHHGDILAQDWRACVASDYHPIFTKLVVLIFALDESGWIFGLANVLLTALGGFLIYRIITALVAPPQALAVFAIVAGFSVITRTESVSDSYIFSTYLQPSTFGAVGFLGGIYFFLRGRFLLSGVALAAGGLIHANFLVLSFPVFGLAHLFHSRRVVFGDLMKQFAFPLLAMTPFLILILDTAMAENSVQAQEIFFKIRSPHHYDPSSFARGFLSVLGWVLVSLAARWWSADGNPAGRAARSLVYSLFALTVVATLLTSVVWVPFVAQLYVWRITPLAVLLVQILAARWFVAEIIARGAGPDLPATASLLGGVALLTYYYYFPGYEYRVTVLFLVLGSIAVLARLGAFSRRHEGVIFILLGLAAVLMGPVLDTTRIKQYSNLMHGFPDSETALYEWVKGTDKEAMFVVPINMGRFRFHARRAIVVDWKSTPIVADDVLEWYRRLEVLCGTPGFQSRAEAAAGYDRMTRERLAGIKAEFDPDFVVLHAEHENGLTEWFPVAYRNERYVVLSMR